MSRRDRRQMDRPAGELRGVLRIHDLGEEAHLEIEQRVDWKVALEILKELKAPNAPLGRAGHPRRMKQRARDGVRSARTPKRKAA